jgi:hypothetical protein
MLPVVARVNGRPSVTEIYEAAREAGEMPEAFPLHAFVELTALMTEKGLMQVDMPA